MMPVVMTHKRFVLLAGKGGRALAAIAGLTPARADLLLRLSKGPLVQRDIGMELCVGAAVISRMVSALERLGFVKRSRVPGDGRLRLVSLLERATRALNKLYDGFVPDDGTGDIGAGRGRPLFRRSRAVAGDRSRRLRGTNGRGAG